MCNGPEDTPKNIKACLEQGSVDILLLEGMLEDWSRIETPNGIKMTKCIREVLTLRKKKLTNNPSKQKKGEVND